jgi:hypothetical protein
MITTGVGKAAEGAYLWYLAHRVFCLVTKIGGLKAQDAGGRRGKRKRKGRERGEKGRKEGRVTANYWALACLVASYRLGS